MHWTRRCGWIGVRRISPTTTGVKVPPWRCQLVSTYKKVDGGQEESTLDTVASWVREAPEVNMVRHIQADV